LTVQYVVVTCVRQLFIHVEPLFIHVKPLLRSNPYTAGSGCAKTLRCHPLAGWHLPAINPSSGSSRTATSAAGVIIRRSDNFVITSSHTNENVVS